MNEPPIVMRRMARCHNHFVQGVNAMGFEETF